MGAALAGELLGVAARSSGLERWAVRATRSRQHQRGPRFGATLVGHRRRFQRLRAQKPQAGLVVLPLRIFRLQAQRLGHLDFGQRQLGGDVEPRRELPLHPELRKIALAPPCQTAFLGSSSRIF